MRVVLLGGPKDGHEIDMGSAWPAGPLPPRFRFLESPPPVTPSLLGHPNARLEGVLEYRLWNYNDERAVYRHPNVKL